MEQFFIKVSQILVCYSVLGFISFLFSSKMREDVHKRYKGIPYFLEDFMGTRLGFSELFLDAFDELGFIPFPKLRLNSQI